jgi:hypothetical protein
MKEKLPCDIASQQTKTDVAALKAKSNMSPASFGFNFSLFWLLFGGDVSSV